MVIDHVELNHHVAIVGGFKQALEVFRSAVPGALSSTPS
jgi:hypothetical protein